MMNLEILQKSGVRQVLHLLGEKFDRWSDFVMTIREVSVSEFGVFSFAVLRVIWVWFYGEGYLNCSQCGPAPSIFLFVFSFTVILHFGVVLFSPSRRLRVFAVGVNGFFSGCLFIFAITQAVEATTGLFALWGVIFSGIVAVKIARTTE